MTARTRREGLDLTRLDGWLDQSVADVPAGTSQATVIAGGRSNLTYLVTRDRWACVVRRPPVGPLLATAHDMVREYRFQTALRGTPVPVPRTLALCEDLNVLGVPFYAMEYVRGTAYRTARELSALGAERTRMVSERLVDVLADLHSVAPASVGIGEIGRADTYLARQVRRWHTQLQSSRTRDLRGAESLHQLLTQAVPERSNISLVHGDYRLDNTLVDHRGTIAAVLDWELATLGDPLADLALMLAFNRLPALGGAAVGDASTAPGYLTEDETLERYAGAHDLPPLGFYLGLACFKLAAVLEGVHHRFLNGQAVGEDFEGVGDVVEPLIESGIEAMKENR